MSYYDRASSSVTRRKRPATTGAAAWSNKPLSNSQKAKLAIAARSAWAAHTQAGLTDENFDDWRHAQTRIACGTESLRSATNQHFRSILAHFLRLAGKTSAAEAMWQKTGRVAGSNQIHDTHENRDTARALIRDLVANSHGRITDAYVAAIVRDKFAGTDYYNLTALDLQQLLYTLKARFRKPR